MSVECLVEIGQAPSEKSSSTNEDNKYKQIFRLPAVHYLAFFILIYVGVEVTIGGQWTRLLQNFSVLTASADNRRLDRDFCERRSSRGPILWVHFGRILWW